MTERDLMRAVMEAARVVIKDRTHSIVLLSDLADALDALDAHREPEPAGEVVEVRAVVLMSPCGANWTVFGSDIHEDDADMERRARLRCSPDDSELRIATITARVPPPTLPIIAAEVE